MLDEELLLVDCYCGKLRRIVDFNAGSRLTVLCEVLYYSVLLSKQSNIGFCACESISRVVCFIASRYSVAYFYVRLSSAYVKSQDCSCEKHYHSNFVLQIFY